MSKKPLKDFKENLDYILQNCFDKDHPEHPKNGV
jgi:hypothetical protein